MTAMQSGLAPPAAAGHPGLALMGLEMARQCDDGLSTIREATSVAAAIATALRMTGRAALYGMGGSHYVNRMVEPLYRAAGIDAHAVSASEALMAPLPPAPRVALFVSQSGESGEIVELLRIAAPEDRRFALTLNARSTLAGGVKAAIVATGGPEVAFAATRSIVLSVAMHAAVLEALGQDQGALREVLRTGATADIAALDEALAGCDTIVFAGRHVMQGVAQSAALSLMELSRVPAIGFETGQFRHGPFEFLRPGLAIVLFRSTGPDFASIAPVAAETIAAGCMTAVLDAAEGALPARCIRIALPRNAGLAAATSMLLTLQRVNIAVALRRVPKEIGSPVRTSKITV
jgi:fructoselysine-6-P-deglycase FrlB-like protein